jgi:hypothetical protein
MQHRPAPTPTKYDLPPRLKNDPQVQKWAKRLMGDPDARPDDLTEDQLTFVFSEVMKRRPGFEPTAFNKAMKETCPILAAPDQTDTVEDLGHIFAHPEMKAFWAAWTGPQGSRGGEIDYAGAKGVMSFMSMSGVTPYVDDAHERYANDASLQELIGQVEAATFGRWPQAAVSPAPYKSLVRHVNKAAPSCWREAMKANIAMVRALALLRPDEGIGERLLIDGASIPSNIRSGDSSAKEDDGDRYGRYSNDHPPVPPVKKRPDCQQGKGG